MCSETRAHGPHMVSASLLVAQALLDDASRAGAIGSMSLNARLAMQHEALHTFLHNHGYKEEASACEARLAIFDAAEGTKQQQEQQAQHEVDSELAAEMDRVREAVRRDAQASRELQRLDAEDAVRGGGGGGRAPAGASAPPAPPLAPRGGSSSSARELSFAPPMAAPRGAGSSARFDEAPARPGVPFERGAPAARANGVAPNGTLDGGRGPSPGARRAGSSPPTPQARRGAASPRGERPSPGPSMARNSSPSPGVGRAERRPPVASR